MSLFITPIKFFFIALVSLVMYLVGFFPWQIQSKFAYPLAYLIRRSSRWRVILRNLEICFPEWDEKRRIEIAYKHCHYVACMPFFMFNSLHRASILTSQVKRVKGLEYLQTLKAQGKGCLLLGHHSTVIDVANRYVSQYFDVVLTYQKGEEVVSNFVMEKVRQRLNTLIEKGQAMSLIRALRKGEIVWLTADQDHGGKMKEKLNFFGHLVNSITGWDRLLKVENVELYLIDMYYEEDGFVIEIEPPFENYQSMSSKEIAQCYMSHVEKKVRCHPEQYYWVHRRFKSTSITY